MTPISTMFSRAGAILLGLVLLGLNPTLTVAADVTFPKGVRVGLKPLGGLSPAVAFTGFESADDAVKVLVAELPAQAYTEVETALKSGTLPPGGLKPEALETSAGPAFFTVEDAMVGSDPVKRYAMVIRGMTFSGYIAVQVAQANAAKYPEASIKGMLATATTRASVPNDEQLSMLPFRMDDLAGFSTLRMIAPGAAVLVADSETDAVETGPFMIIGTISSAPERPDDRGRFAQQAAALIPGLRDAKLISSEPMRIDGSPGYETRLEAISGKGETAVNVVQWLRFGSGTGAVRIIASAPRDQWPAAFTRFRAVRDGIGAK